MQRRSSRCARALGVSMLLFSASCGSGTALVVATVGDEIHLDNPFQTDGQSNAILAPGQFPNPQAPGSLLLFPFVRELGGASRTYINLTNTNLSAGTRVELRFVDGQSCVGQAPVSITLAPGDTWTALVGAVAPVGVASPTHAWADAVDTGGRPVAFDYLVGTALEVFDNDVTGEVKVCATAFAFQTVLQQNTLTDLDQDGHFDLDGREYSPLPDTYLFPGLVGQDANGFFNDSVVVLSFDGPGAVTVFDTQIRNDQGDLFTAQSTVTCWNEFPLLALNPASGQAFLAAQLNDPNEIVGETTSEACWLSIRSASPTGATPGLFAFLIHKTFAADVASAVQMPVLIGQNTTVEVRF